MSPSKTFCIALSLIISMNRAKVVTVYSIFIPMRGAQ